MKIVVWHRVELSTGHLAVCVCCCGTLKAHKLFKTLSSTVAVVLGPVAAPDYLQQLKYSCVCERANENNDNYAKIKKHKIAQKCNNNKMEGAKTNRIKGQSVTVFGIV